MRNLNTWEPQIGETVWFENDFESMTTGKVVDCHVVDQFNGYKSFTVETDDGQGYSLFASALFREKNDLLKEELKSLMNDRVFIDNRIAYLERQLTGE